MDSEEGDDSMLAHGAEGNLAQHLSLLLVHQLDGEAFPCHRICGSKILCFCDLRKKIHYMLCAHVLACVYPGGEGFLFYIESPIMD